MEQSGNGIGLFSGFRDRPLLGQPRKPLGDCSGGAFPLAPNARLFQMRETTRPWLIREERTARFGCPSMA